MKDFNKVPGARESRAGDDFHSQLKYSTRNPGKEWTVAQLCKGKDSTGRGSVIRRLADAFERYYSIYGREAVLRKLKLKLVRNLQVDSGRHGL